MTGTLRRAVARLLQWLTWLCLAASLVQPLFATGPRYGAWHASIHGYWIDADLFTRLEMRAESEWRGWRLYWRPVTRFIYDEVTLEWDGNVAVVDAHTLQYESEDSSGILTASALAEWFSEADPYLSLTAQDLAPVVEFI